MFQIQTSSDGYINNGINGHELAFALNKAFNFSLDFQEHGELEFRRGDVITVTDKSDQVRIYYAINPILMCAQSHMMLFYEFFNEKEITIFFSIGGLANQETDVVYFPQHT